MTRYESDLVICDCTFKSEDHWISRPSRRKHRQKYPRHSQSSNVSQTSLSVFNQSMTSSRLPGDVFDVYGRGYDNDLMMDDEFSNIQSPIEEEISEYGLESDENEGDERLKNDDGSDSADEEDIIEEDEIDSLMDVEEHVSEDEQIPSENNEIARLKSLSIFEVLSEWKETLRYFEWKCRSNTSDRSYEKLRTELAESAIRIKSLRVTRRFLESCFGLHITTYHRCINNCMVFIGHNSLQRRCIHCKAERFYAANLHADIAFFPDIESYSHLTPNAVYSYIPIIPRLKLLFAHPDYAKKMRYPKDLLNETWDGLRDIWDGNAMMHWRAAGYFQDDRTVALHFSTDGVQLFKGSKQEVWPFLVLNLNLPPEERFNSDNFLPLGLCPGPSQPKDLDSFLVPFIEELDILCQGVIAYDAQTKSPFLLKAHLVLLSGDTPGISKLLHLRGHVAKYPCRACKLEGTPYKFTYKSKKGRIGEHTRYYYPLHPPMNLPLVQQQRQRRQRHDLIHYINNLPPRTPENYLIDGNTSLKDPKSAMNSGVNGISPLVHQPTIRIPESAPFDVMHLIYLVFMRDLCALFSGKFFTEEHLNDHDARMSEKEWACLGDDMSKIRAPVSWGRYPRNIEKYINSFKAEELGNFLIHYLLPLSFNRVNRTTYRALQRLVLSISLATSYQIRRNEIDEIEEHLYKFVEWYYDTFYQMKSERLPACKYTTHALLHLTRDIRNWGPASYYWQFPEERLCGILVSQVKSRVHGSENLSILMHQHQLLTLMSRFQFLQRPLASGTDSFETKEYGKDYSFLPPCKGQRELTSTEFNHLKQHYITMYSLPSQAFVHMDHSIQIWHRCRVDKTIYHCSNNQRKNSTRLNHLVCIEQTVDANARFRHGVRPELMVPREFYAYVHFYCVHIFRGQPHMLMYSSYRKIAVHDGLVEDLGPHRDGFQDIRVLQHLCAKVTGYGGKVYFVDEPEVMEDRLREALLQ